MKDLSVIIVNYRCWDKLVQCLDSLNEVHETNFTFEVIIVDNASGDGKLFEFRQLYPQFRFFQNQGNYGFASGNNLGAANARGKYFLFLNPDTIVSEKALQAMLDQVKVSNANSIISCRQVRENGAEDKSYGVFPTPLALTGWTRALAKILKMNHSLSENIHFKSPDWVSGSVIMIGNAGFSAIGRWDERFWMYYEDVDLCRRARDAGGAIYLLKSATVIHNHGGSSRSNAEITALTKTEVNISRHEYLSLHENGSRELLMHTFLIFDHLLLGLLTAIPGLFLFFNKSLFGATKIYLKLIHYYLCVLNNGTWISPRSVQHPELFLSGDSVDQNLLPV